MRLSGLGVTYDENGNVIPDRAVDDTLGGKLWRFFNPTQEAAEYTGMGVPPPPETTAGDVYAAGARDLHNVSVAAYNESKSVMQWVVIGLVAYAVITVIGKIPQSQIRGIHRAVSRRLAG